MSSPSNQTWIAYTDGASRGNPGEAGCGALVVSPDGEEISLKHYLGYATNNQAEYRALIMALEELVRRGAESALIRADSELMVRQMQGRYRVKNENILPLFEEARALAVKISAIVYEHVRRELNKDADRLANSAIDEGP